MNAAVNASDPQAQAGAAIQQPQADPMATDPMAGDPNAAMGGEMPDSGMEDATANNGDTSEIDDLWGKLGTEDRSALLKYGESMVDDNATVDDAEAEAGIGDETGEGMGGDAMADPTMQDPTMQQPMAESVIFTKSQLKKLNEMRNLMK